MYKLYLIAFIFITTFLISDAYEPLDIDFLKKKIVKKELKPTSPLPEKKNVNKKQGLPPFEVVSSDLDKIQGLFTLFWDKDKNKFLLALKPNQLDKIYLANLTRKSGDAQYYDSGSMLWEFPFIFERLGDVIQLVHINTSFRADQSSAIHRSIDNFSNSIISTGKVVSSPHAETGEILIDAAEMFVRDISYFS